MTEIIPIYYQNIVHQFKDDSLILKEVMSLENNNHCILVSSPHTNKKIYLETPLFSTFTISNVINSEPFDYYDLTIEGNDEINQNIISCFGSLDNCLVKLLSHSDLDILSTNDFKYRGSVRENNNKKVIQFKLIQKVKKEYSEDYITTLYSPEGVHLPFDILTNKQKKLQISIIAELIGCIIEQKIVRPLLRIDQACVQEVKSVIPCNKLNQYCFMNRKEYQLTDSIQQLKECTLIDSKHKPNETKQVNDLTTPELSDDDGDITDNIMKEFKCDSDDDNDEADKIFNSITNPVKHIIEVKHEPKKQYQPPVKVVQNIKNNTGIPTKAETVHPNILTTPSTTKKYQKKNPDLTQTESINAIRSFKSRK